MAWDSQVGAHTQWGSNDSQLFYNKLEYNTTPSHTKHHVIYGVVCNIFIMQCQRLDCPIYQVSPDGNYALSPDLSKIGFTQKGYGVHVHHPMTNTKQSLYKDGLFKTEIRTGKCQLIVTLSQTAKLLKLIPSDSRDISLYGFHVKWSSDSQLIMFIVRSLHFSSSSYQSSNIFSISGIFEAIGGAVLASKTSRVQHIFVCDSNGLNLRYVLSYGAHSYSHSRLFPGLLNGNHPNWIPNTHCISMNRERVVDQTSSRSAVTTASTTTSGGATSGFYLFTLNVSPHASRDGGSSCTSSSGRSSSSDVLVVNGYQGMYHYRGTGHPSFLPGGRYVLTDAYLKEKKCFPGLLPGHVPILLIDLSRQRHAILKQVKVTRGLSRRSSSHFFEAIDPVKGPWRCDPHPVFSRDFEWIAYNGRASDQTRARRLYLLRILPNLSNYFDV